MRSNDYDYNDKYKEYIDNNPYAGCLGVLANIIIGIVMYLVYSRL